ncbi:MAG: hypothetical protein M5U22_13025 [Thermoleophilia bacterium]|nr:hypothetical protein [Thermoleophilia bacterium]
MAQTEDGALVAWVDGSDRYATKVVTDDDGMPDSICTCPYECDCKHGVAVLLEYLERVEHNRRVPQAGEGDERLELLADENRDDEIGENQIDSSYDAGKEIEQDLSDRRQIVSGDAKKLVTRLRREIREIGAKPGWKNYWQGEGYTPDYSGIRKKLEVLLKEGHADEVLTLGRELLTTGTRQVEESDDEGETAGEIAGCMPVIVEALDQSSLGCADKLGWALDAVLEDEFELCDDLAEYLRRQHPESAWQALTDRLLARLHDLKSAEGAGDFSRNYARDQLSDWAIHAMERAGREDEIIPLCEAEATKTSNYGRLVERLVAARRYDDAEHWIQKGFRATEERWPGIAAGLRNQLREIRALEKNWPAVAAMQAEEFVRHPSRKTFTDCKGASSKVKAWPQVRAYLLDYLEKRRPALGAGGLAASGNPSRRPGNRTERPFPHGGRPHRYCHSGREARSGAALVRPAVGTAIRVAWSRR